MIIQVDQEGKGVIEQFCDMALKMSGPPLQNLKQVNLVLETLVTISEPKSKPMSPPAQQPEQPEQPGQSEQPEQS